MDEWKVAFFIWDLLRAESEWGAGRAKYLPDYSHEVELA